MEKKYNWKHYEFQYARFVYSPSRGSGIRLVYKHKEGFYADFFMGKPLEEHSKERKKIYEKTSNIIRGNTEGKYSDEDLLKLKILSSIVLESSSPEEREKDFFIYDGKLKFFSNYYRSKVIYYTERIEFVFTNSNNDYMKISFILEDPLNKIKPNSSLAKEKLKEILHICELEDFSGPFKLLKDNDEEISVGTH